MKRIILVLLSMLFAIVAAACSPGNGQNVAQAGPHSWIDAPLNGSNLPPGQVQVVSHSSDLQHVAQVELSVNGAVLRADPSPDSQETLVTTKQDWVPPGPGSYTLMVRARNTLGAWGEYAQAVVNITGTGGVVQGAVYTDLNANGLPNDPGDAPMDDVAVTLSGCDSQTTTTVNGTFQFTGLPAGTCLVEVSKAGWKFSGTFPAGIGYPARVASDPSQPTAFSLFMTPVKRPTRTPTPAPNPAAPTALPAVTIAFFADQLTLVAGSCTTLHWEVTNASQVFVDGDSVAASDSKQVCPVRSVDHLLRVVTLDKQSVRRTLSINVVTATRVPVIPPTRVPTLVVPTSVPTVVPPTITTTPTTVPTPVVCRGTPNIPYFSANPTAIPPNGSTTLSWGAVTNADSVEIDNGIGGVPTPGSRSVSLKSTTTFTLFAHCGSNTVTRQVTVTVARGIFTAPTPTLQVIK